MDRDKIHDICNDFLFSTIWTGTSDEWTEAEALTELVLYFTDRERSAWHPSGKLAKLKL